MEKQPSKLARFATKLVSDNTFIKASFGGFAGSGKTRTATEFIIGCMKELKIEAPVLIIDNEKGSRFLIPIFEKAGIECHVKETVHLADIQQAFQLVTEGEVGFLFIDSLTKVWYQFIRDYKNVNNKKMMTLQDWGKILPAWQESFSDRFVAMSGNCVFTGRGGNTYDVEENEETHKKEFVKSGVKMKMAGETPFEPDLNVWMDQVQRLNKDGELEVWREAQILKDRSGIIDGKIFHNPTYKNFAPVVQFIMGTPKGEVAKETFTDNLAPAEDFEHMARRDRREIENEKIKAQFDKAGFGTSKEDKQLKIQILEKIFNSTSQTEIEKMPTEQLTKCRENLEIMFSNWFELPDYEQKSRFVKDFQINFLNE